MVLYDLFDGLIIGLARAQKWHLFELDKLLQFGQIAKPGLLEHFIRFLQIHLDRAKEEEFRALVFRLNRFDGQDGPGLIGRPA